MFISKARSSPAHQGSLSRCRTPCIKIFRLEMCSNHRLHEQQTDRVFISSCVPHRTYLLRPSPIIEFPHHFERNERSQSGPGVRRISRACGCARAVRQTGKRRIFHRINKHMEPNHEQPTPCTMAMVRALRCFEGISTIYIGTTCAR